MNYFQGLNVTFTPSSFSYFMEWFHNFNCSLIFGVLMFVFIMMCYLSFVKNFFLVNLEYQWGELFCGIIPIVILCLQMVPSLSLLYYYGLMSFNSDLNLKVIGHQWYWSYEYSDFNNVIFDSYMKSSDILEMGDLRLLEVDNRCILPIDMNVRFCISSLDVIHSWTIFNFFIKLDAMSGMISVFHFSFPVVGVFFGQCSEICGANHSFMPIVLETTLFSMFKNWCLTF